MKELAKAFTVTLLLVVALRVHAQSQGENGANRRVITVSGYGGVTGQFSEPSFGNLKTTYDDKPQMYMGVRGPFEVDAGLSWTPNNDGRTVNKWRAFMRVKGGPETQLYYGGRAWYVNKGTLGTVTQDMLIISDHIHLELRRGGVTLSRNQLIPVPSAAAAAAMIGKRVIAMTQANGTHLDGSWLMNAGFSSGRVQAISFNSSTGKFEEGDWIGWELVGGDSSHFFPGGRYGEKPSNQQLLPPAIGTPFVIDLSPPNARDMNGDPTNPAPLVRDGLFSSETVNMHLFAKVTAKGRKAKHRGKGH